MSTVDPWKAISLLLKRSELLAELRAGPAHQPELQDALGVSRSTVYKAVRELEGISLVESTDEGYRLSLLGRLLFDEFDRFSELTADVCRPAELLMLLDPGVELSVGVLSGADFVVADRHAPDRPIHSVELMAEEATELNAISPVVLPQYISIFSEEIVEKNLVADFVLEEPVVEYLVTNYRSELQEGFASGNLEIWATDDVLPYGLIVVTEPTGKVGIVIYNEAGELRGFISNDTPEAVEWGTQAFERYRARATRYAANDW